MCVNVGDLVSAWWLRVTTLDIDRLEVCTELVASSNVILVLPVNHASSPLDGARCRCRGTGRPKAELDTRRSRWELVTIVRRLECTDCFAVNLEDKSVWRPINCVIVPVGIGIGQTLGSVTMTVLTLPEKVGLALSNTVSRELPIDFIASVAHGNEADDDAIPSACLQRRCDCAVVDESGTRQTGARVCFCQDHNQIVVSDLNVSAVENPVVLIWATVILGAVGEDAVGIGKLIGLRLADRTGLAAGHRV